MIAIPHPSTLLLCRALAPVQRRRYLELVSLVAALLGNALLIKSMASCAAAGYPRAHYASRASPRCTPRIPIPGTPDQHTLRRGTMQRGGEGIKLVFPGAAHVSNKQFIAVAFHGSLPSRKEL